MQTRNSSDARGIDVSAYQGNINWSQVAADGISFAFIKATEGTAITDSLFARNFPSAKAAGILTGAYHFARPGESSAVAEANHFIQVVSSAGGFGNLPPVLDMEDNGGLSNQALASWIQQWMNHVKTSSGKQPILYTYPNFADTHLPPSLGNLPLWIADYGVNQPSNTSGWTTWTFWQYSDSGLENGISGNVDLDVYSGTLNALHQAFGTGSTSPASSPKPASAPAPAPSANYTQFNVFVLSHPYAAIAVGDVTYVLWTALDTLGTMHTYKGNGLMNVDGQDVQGVVYEGNTYLPWDSLAPGIKSQRVWHFYT